MPAKCMRLVVALGAAVTMAAGIGHAQTVDVVHAHRDAVDVYIRTGDINRAVAPLQNFTPNDFERAIDGLIETKDVNRMRVAAIFHLDIGLALVGLNSSRRLIVCRRTGRPH